MENKLSVNIEFGMFEHSVKEKFNYDFGLINFKKHDFQRL